MDELGRITVVKIKHQFTYLCSFNSNIQSLRNETQKLENAIAGLQGQVEAAKNNAEVILPEVETWLENASNKIQVDKSGIDDEIPSVKNRCWGIKSRYLLSRKAAKIAGEMKQLVEERSMFNDISTPPPPAAQVSIPLGTTYHEFQSRKQIEEDIMKALRAKEVRMIGIGGMGGVGKTTMAIKIKHGVRKEDLFHEVVMTIVGQQVDMLKIQDEIGESLGLKLDEKTLSARANKLRARLTEKKRILIILDDVWEVLNLEDLGIPCGNEACTILLTSRNRDVLKKMDAQKIYEVEILSETEAWLLFRERAGTCVDDPNLLSIAKKVAVEYCNGLPIALITVGDVLKDQTSISLWEDALQQLKSSNPEDIPEVVKEVYNPLKLSYTNLESRHAKSLFLLCCLFPEDDDISLEELTYHCMGLRMFLNLDFSKASEGTLENVRKRVFTIVGTLKNCFLLLKGKDERHVRMHNIVRDVAIYIALKEAKEGIVDVKINSIHSSPKYTYRWVSVFSEKISSLLRMHASYREKRFEIKDFSLFEKPKELNVLSFSYISLKSLPLEIQLLKNLRSLHLYCCTVESLSAVGDALSLEILYCHGCDGIEELPIEIVKLNQLKLFYFSYCRSLRKIPPGVISNLVQLEELMIVKSFDKWEANAEQRENAALCELEHLKNLTRLEIEIENVTLAAEVICLPLEKVKYNVRFGGSRWESSEPPESGMIHKFKEEGNTLGKWINVIFDGLKGIQIGYDNISNMWCHQIPPVFFSQLEVFEIYNSSSTRTLFSSSIVVNLVNLKELRISKCKEMVKLIEDDEKILPHQLFPSLHCLHLEDLPKLENFCSWRHDFHLPCLEEICIKGCHCLGFFTMKNVLFRSLKKIVIRDCNNIGSVTFDGSKGILIGYDNISNIWCHQIPPVFFNQLEVFEIYNSSSTRTLFSSSIVVNLVNLKELRISKCKEMVKVIEDDEEILSEKPQQLFPSLHCLYLEDLPKLESFCSWRHVYHMPSLEKVWIKWCHFSGFFTMKNVLFRSLKKIVIRDCNNIGSLFSSPVAENLDNLKTLSILRCKEMVQVIENDAERSILFPNLSVLDFGDLPKLQSFCNWRCDLQLLSLENVDIYSCPLLKKFSMGSISTPNLKRVQINSKLEDVGRLES